MSYKTTSSKRLMERPAFLNEVPPAGYIPGLGRGATGFTTRSDLGTSKMPSRLRMHDYKPREHKHPVRITDDNTLKESSSKTGYSDDEDNEADRIYTAIDQKLLSTSHSKKSNKILSQSTRFSEQFIDLKRSLVNVSETEWLNIPEVGDITKKNKRQKIESQQIMKMYAAPDTLLSTHVNLSKLTEEREKLLGQHLDTTFHIANSDQGLEDMADYLRQLDIPLNNTDRIHDLKKMRLILASYCNSDPRNPQGWIEAARLEEKAGEFHKARAIIDQGCKYCSKNPDIWLENIRLNQNNLSYCKVLIGNALKFNNTNEQMWIKAIDLEKEPYNKIRIIHKALRNNATSEKLWKLAVDHESDKIESIKILQKAIEFIPTSVELLTALIDLQPYSDAIQTLNNIKKHYPNNRQILIITAQLEETKNLSTLEKLIELLTNGLDELISKDNDFGIHQWIKEAISIEQLHMYPMTVKALVTSVLTLKCKDNDIYMLLDIVDEIDAGAYYTKSSIYQHIVTSFPDNILIWKKFFKLGRIHNKIHDVYNLLDKLLFDDHSILEKYPILGLLYSKEVWIIDNDINRAENIIDQCLKKLPYNLDFWLAKAKLLTFEKKWDKAKTEFKEAIKITEKMKIENSQRLWYKYVTFLRYVGEIELALDVLNKCLTQFQDYDIFYLQKGQIYTEMSQFNEARQCYSIGISKLPHSIPLWISLATLEEIHLGKPTKARSHLDLALLKNPNSDQLYLAKARMEQRLKNKDQAVLIISQGLKNLPDNPYLWCENIKLLTKKSSQKTMFQDALKKTNNHGMILTQIGIALFNQGEYLKASKWFEKAISRCPTIGDSWIWHYKCQSKLKNNNLKDIVNSVCEVEPKNGDIWRYNKKKISNIYFTCRDLFLQIIQDDKILTPHV